MSVKLWSNRLEQFVDGTGVPRSGGKLFTYVGGSVNTKQTTYTESTGSTPNTNPIVLDSNGRIPQPVWLTTGVSYKFVLAPSTDTDPPTSPIDTLDVITGINDSSASQSEWIAGPAPTFVSATSFTLVGDQTSQFTVGRRLKTTNTSGTIYSTIITSAFAAATTVTVVNDSGVIDSGLSAVNYGILQATNKSVPPFDNVVALSTVAGTNTITAVATKSAAPLSTGQCFSFVPANTNTGATTLNINSLGAKNVFTHGAACTAGEIRQNIPVVVQYDGTQFNIVGGGLDGFANQTANTFLAGPATGAAAQPTFRAPVGADGASMVLIGAAQTASNSVTIDFTSASYASAFDGTFDVVEFTLTGIVPATDDVLLHLRVSESSAFKSGGTDYQYQGSFAQSGAVNVLNATAAQIIVAQSISNTAADGGVNGQVRGFQFSSTTKKKVFRSITSNYRTATSMIDLSLSGRFQLDNGAIDGVRFLMSSGNITSGVFALYGIRKA